MKTIAVPVEPTEEMYLSAYKIYAQVVSNHGHVKWTDVRECIKAAILAAPPQPEPADHLAAPDSREREIIAAARALIPFLIEGWDEDDGPEHYNASNAACDRLIAAVNAAATQGNASPSGAESTDPAWTSSAAPDAILRISSDEKTITYRGTPYFKGGIASSEAVDACSRCGQVGAKLDDGHVCATINGLPGAHLREQIAAAQARQTRGEGIPGDCELAHYDENHGVERRVAQRRIRPAAQGDPIRRFIPDRRQNAAGLELDYKSASADVTDTKPVPAAPGTLPLSAERVNQLCNEFGFSMHNGLRKQALRAIELEQQVAGLRRDIEIRDHSLSRQIEETSRLVKRAEKAGAQLAEKDAKIAWWKDRHAKALTHAFNLGNRAEELEQRLAEKDREIKRLEIACAESNKEADELDEMTHSLEKEPLKAEAELAELKARMK